MNFNMGNLYKGQDGTYKDVNGNIVGYWNRKKSGITGLAWKYLNSKYGSDWANRVSRNMARGYVYKNGKWDYDANDPRKNSGTPIELNTNEDNSTWKFTDKDGRFNTASVFKGLVNGAAKSLGYNVNLNNTAGDLASGIMYFIPGVGNVASATDAIDNFKHGEYLDGIVSSLFALPIVGNIGAGLRMGSRLAKVAKLGNTSKKLFNAGTKLSKSVEKASPLVGKALTAYSIPTLGNFGYLLYTGYNDISNTRADLAKDAEKIKEYLGEDSEEYKFISRPNNFSNNMKDLLFTSY